MGLWVAFQSTGSPLDEFLGENVTVTGFFPFHHLDEWRFFPAYDLPNAFAYYGRFEIYKGFFFLSAKKFEFPHYRKGEERKDEQSRKLAVKLMQMFPSQLPFPRCFVTPGMFFVSNSSRR